MTKAKINIALSPEAETIALWLGDGNRSYGIEQALYIAAALSVASRAIQAKLALSEYIPQHEVDKALGVINSINEVSQGKNFLGDISKDKKLLEHRSVRIKEYRVINKRELTKNLRQLVGTYTKLQKEKKLREISKNTH